MPDKLISRNEYFGKAVFNQNDLSYKLLSHEDYLELKDFKNIREIHNDATWNDNILYSPIKVYFDLTGACNLRCRSCHNSSAFPVDGELDTIEAISVLNGLKEDSVFYVKFSGGELTMRNDWSEILSFGKDLGLAIGLNTNGIYSKRTLDKLINHDVDEIDISLDGLKKTNDAIRGEGTFERITSSIKALSDAGKPVTINSLLTKLTTEEDINAVLDIAEKYSCPVGFFHIRPIGRGSSNTYLNLDFDSLAGLYSIIKDARKGRNLVKNEGGYRSTGESFGLIDGGREGFTNLNILPDGSLYAGGCVRYVAESAVDRLCLGNIKDENYSILKIWHDDKRLWEIRSMHKQYQDRCNICMNHNDACLGFTPEMQFYHEVNGKNPFCRIDLGDYSATFTGVMRYFEED